MDIKTDDLKSMIDSHHNNVEIDRLRQEREQLLKKQKHEKRVKKQTRRVAISAGLILMAGVAIGTSAKKGIERFEGRNAIISEFDDLTSSYGVREDSNAGFIVNKDTSFLDLDTAVDNIVNDAKMAGMTDDEIAIGIDSMFNENVAEKAMGEYPSLSERNEAYDNAYHESKVSDINKGASK